MNTQPRDHSKLIKHVFIVPHTHWDREWYLPFQKFRYKLVHLIDELLEILNSQEFFFTFDGQTIVLEDYFEIRPEKKQELLDHIREGKIRVGPWYLLPDIWLVGQESLIRNLEYSIDMARDLDIPLMKIGYLPDMFGHSRAIPQIIGDLTNFKAAVVWRGVPPEINTVPFQWKSDHSSVNTVFTIYLPFGYGNAARLPVEVNDLTNSIQDHVNHLKPFSPLPVYLLANGTDHQFPSSKIASNLSQVQIDNMNVSLSVLDDFIEQMQRIVAQEAYSPPEYVGEFRSSARAPLLQDTYSTRMWIKQWNQKLEDLLTHYAEPMRTYMWVYFQKDYPTSFLVQAWKWFLRNQPHDSICGCSVDQIHEEMKFRFSFSESIAEMTIEEVVEDLEDLSHPSKDPSLIVFNPTNSLIPMYFEFKVPAGLRIHSAKIANGKEFEVQSLLNPSDIATGESEQKFGTLIPLKPWSFTPLHLMTSETDKSNKMVITASQDEVSNVFFNVTFNEDGTFDLFDKKKGVKFTRLHQFEDWGDIGDEYTFGRLGPEQVAVQNTVRNLSITGNLFCEIQQTMRIKLFREVDSSRQKRIGKVEVPIKSTFRFYRDLPRIDIKTELLNITKDHRLRICFDLPYRSQYTITSTHFGYIKRSGDPTGDESFVEAPSGIQSQKRYICVEDPDGQVAATLMNNGLPEVELVEGTRLALTLIRSVGWLSRSDINERPLHAGPFLATPGAQELNQTYKFEYSFLVHDRNTPMYKIEDHSEAFALHPVTIFRNESKHVKEINQALIQIDNPNIRISSLRVRDGKIRVTLYNILKDKVSTRIKFSSNVKKIAKVKIDGSIIGESEVIEKLSELSLDPLEIMMITIE
ncbi:MAG: glycoside hydrolase family 38 N-terminal domain-containing protein [Candidatus Hodarchaeales archaeon]